MLKSIQNINPMNMSLVFIGLMFSIPFISMHHEQPITTFYTEWLAASLGLMAIIPLLFLSCWKASQTHLKIPQISLIFVGLGAVLCVQWILGMLHSNQYALSVLSYFVWAFLLVLLGSALRHKLGLEKLTTILAWCLVGAGIMNIGIVVLQFVTRTGGVIPFLPNLNSFGAISQTNHFANFCALAITSLIYLYAKGKFSLSFFNLILVLFMMMLSFSGSRSAWLYLSVITVLIINLRFNSRQEAKSKHLHDMRRISFSLIPIFIVVQFFIYFVIPNEFVNLPTERLLDGVTAKTASARIQFWYDSLRMFFQHPWLGVGAGKFMSSTFLLLDTPSAMASKRVFEHAHNLFLHLLAEMGIAGFSIVLVGLFSWVKAFKWRDLTLETWWIISLIAILGIHSMLEYPLWFTFFLGIAAVLLGAGDEKFFNLKTSKYSIKFAHIGLIATCLFGLYHITTSLIANAKLESWLQKFGYEDINDSAQLNWVEKFSLLSPYGELMRAGLMDVDSKLINKQFSLSQSVLNFKTMKTIAYRHALLLELKGQHEEAVKQLNRTLIAFPNTFKSFLENPALKYRQEYLDLYAETQAGIANRSK